MSPPNVTNPPSFYLNIPTSDVAAAKTFFTALAFEAITAYSDDKTASFRLPAPNTNICLMVHADARFKEFMRPNTAIIDANTSTEALFSLIVNTREEVDAFLAKAVAAGGKSDPYTMPNFGQDCGLYTRSLADLDGHIWEVCVMLGDCSAGAGEAKKEESK